MARHPPDPLRPLTETERQTLRHCSRSETAPAVEVIRKRKEGIVVVTDPDTEAKKD